MILRKILLIIACLVLLALPTVAQDDGEWSVWLHRDGTSIRVYSNGAVVTLTLPIPIGFTAEGNPSFSGDGNTIGQCATNGEVWHVFIFNAISSSMLFDYAMGDVRGCYVSVNEDGGLVAIVLHLGRSEENYNEQWELHVFDVSSESDVAMLASTDQPLLNQGFYYLPQRVEFRGEQILFSIGITADVFELPSFIWHYVDDRLEPGQWGKFSDTYLPATGETIWIIDDPNLPAIDISGMVAFPLNVVIAADTQGNEHYIFHHPTALVSDLLFLANGRRVAIGFWDEADHLWVTVDRNGSLVSLPNEVSTLPFDRFIYSTVDGFVFLRESEDGFDELIHYRFEGDDLIRSVLWRAQDADEMWDVVWVTPLDGEPGLRPLTELEMITFEGTE